MQIYNYRSSRAVVGSVAVFALIVLFFSFHRYQSVSRESAGGFDTSSIEHELTNLVEGGPRVRQATTSLQNDYDPVYERAIKSHIRHGEIWGYPTHVLRHSMLDTGSGYSQYNKLAFLQMLLLNEMAKPFGERAGWIVWFDADTIVLNPSIPWAAFLPPAWFSDIHFIGSKNWDGYNAGVFFIRVHDWSVKMLGDAQALPSWRPEIEYGWEDQGATEVSYSRPEFRDAVIFQPIHWWNEFQINSSFGRDQPNIRPGDMMIHFAGMGGDKPQYMGPWLDKIENEASQWTVPLENTSYLKNIKEYWEIYGAARHVLGLAKGLMSSESRAVAQKYQLGNASEKLRDSMWHNSVEYESVRNHTDMLADIVHELEGSET